MKLSLSNPLSVPIVTQKFGEISNLEYYQRNGINFVGHNGIDFHAPHGTPIYASHDGQAYYQVDDKGGHGVVVVSNIPYDFPEGQFYVKTIYWHMMDPLKEPQYKSPIADKPIYVKRGDLIGYADSTGLSTGDHLHYALKLGTMQGADFVTRDTGNGYFGCVDPAPYLIGRDRVYFTVDLMIGDNNDLVSELQRRLNVSPVTGYFGSKTFSAVRAYQKANGITATGFVGPKTRSALNK